MDVWTFIWLMVILKIPIVSLFLIVRWAVKDPPNPLGEDGGIGTDPRGPHPHRSRPRRPRPPRRGPHREPAPASPSRVRAVTARSRLTRG